jgi:hypothetical protein
VFDDMLPPSTAVDRFFLTSRCLAPLRYAAVPPTSRAYWAAARGEDDAHRRPQRHERAPPGSPQGGSGDGGLARAGLKWRFQFRSPHFLWISCMRIIIVGRNRAGCKEIDLI